MNNNTIEYIVIMKSSIFILGDERSRMHPGHGYPERYEETETVGRFKNIKELESYLLRHGDENLEIYKVQRITTTKHVSLSYLFS